MQKVILMGRLTRDIEIRYTPKGTAVGGAGIALSEKWKNDAGEPQERTTFVDLTFWGKTAEVVAEYCRKGDGIMVEGKLQNEEWTDKRSGEKKHKLKVVVDAFHFPPGKVGGGQRPEAARPVAHKAAAAPVDGGESDEVGPDGLPF